MLLARVDELASRIQELTAQIHRQVAPFAAQVAQLDAVTGIAVVCAQELIAEIGVDMAVSRPPPTWWRGPSSLPKPTSQPASQDRGHWQGNPWLAATLGEVAVTAGRTHTFLGERDRRIARRRGKQPALVAVGNSIPTIVWHLLADPKPATAIWVPTTTSPAATGTARNAT